MRISHCIVSAALALPVAALADDHQHSLEAHVHGIATLNIALEEQQLELQIESPAMNIVGFEYQPKTATDKQTVEAAQSTLKDAAALFVLNPAAQCTLTSVSVDNDLLEETDEHDHDHDHDHESHSDVESHDAEHSHSDINAHYHYHCSKPAALNNLDLAGFFKQFPRTEKIRVQFITADQQQGVELSHEHTQFNW
jgi:cell division protein ZapA (FtsZ GTPase activity inhibitor)